jgi:hypothetical protein
MCTTSLSHQYMLHTTFLLHANIYCTQFFVSCTNTYCAQLLCHMLIFYAHCTLCVTKCQGFVCSHRTPLINPSRDVIIQHVCTAHQYCMRTNNFLHALPILSAHTTQTNIMPAPPNPHHTVINLVHMFVHYYFSKLHQLYSA